MLTAIVHLSDIHIKAQSDAISSRLAPLAAAVCSTDPTCVDYTFVLSGDIAAHGIQTEYDAATALLAELRSAIATHSPNASLRCFSVPGNHDCFLPETELTLRDALIKAIEPTLQTLNPDPSTLSELLARQQSYFDFSQTLFAPALTATQKLCCSHFVTVGGKRLQFNLYNTALLSRQKERQGELLVPIELLRSLIQRDEGCELAISVFHHTYVWLHADAAVAFRSHIERTTDIALTGHQHVDHAYTKELLSGERILYSEGDVLQDQDNPSLSGFRIILVDLTAQRWRIVTYSWKDNRYACQSDTEWVQLGRTANGLGVPAPTLEFLDRLSNNGLGLVHRSKGPLPLDSVFVYPDATARKLSAPEHQRNVSGSDLLNYLTQREKILIQGAALSGKTALAKTLAKDWLRSRSTYPLLMSGADFRRSDESFFDRAINAEVVRAYGSSSIEAYRQLPPAVKVVIVDDWDACVLAQRERDAVLSRLAAHFGKVVLVVGGLSYIEHLFARLEGKELILEFDLVSLAEMSHVARGQLIDKWLALEIPRESKEFSRTVEETERLIQSVIGRNTLPSLPFIVLSLLQATQRHGDVLPENGAFGYLYEVIITTALNSAKGDNRPQLDKKYEVLPILAFQMFTSGVEMMSASEVEGLIDRYAKTYRVKLNRTSMLEDLLFARVLENHEGNYCFAYDHYFYYFLARYFKTHLDGPDGPALRTQLKGIANGLNSGTNGIFLTFVVYLTHGDRELIEHLLAIGESIFAELPLSNLTDEVDFYNSKSHSGAIRPIPEQIDLEKSREERRRAADQSDERKTAQNGKSEWPDACCPAYSDDMPLAIKLEYARTCMEILGQILRNFTGSLPGEKKHALLTTTYRLGLRTLRAVLEVLSDASVRAKEEMAKRDLKRPEDREFVKAIERLLTILGQIIGSGAIREISLNVGSPEIDEDAYADALEEVGRNHATELIDLAVKLDNGESYPFNKVRDLRHTLKDNRFASSVLRDLVIAHMHVFEVTRDMRQRVLALFKESQSDSNLLSRTTKRLK
jgi:hypothetical protein